MPSKVPLEDVECENFHLWLEARNIPHTHIPNESRSSKKDAYIRGKKLKKMGVSSGYWDYDIYLPVFDISDKVAGYVLVKVEMKRVKGSTTSPAQKDWGRIYRKASIPCAICKGAEEAEKYVLKVAGDISEKTLEAIRGDTF